jgi:Grx4 family monothiol glutaredoxin
MTEVDTTAHFEELVAAHGSGLVVVNFWADWAVACKQMTQVVSTLGTRYPSARFLNVEAEKIYEVAEAHNIESVPTVLLLKSGAEVGRVTGVDVPGLTAQVEALSSAAAAGAAQAPAAGGGCGGACSGDGGCGGGGGSSSSSSSTDAVADTVDDTGASSDLNTRLGKLVASSGVMLFMKGTREEPRCGFSRKAVAMLNDAGVTYSTFDILGDEEVRQGLKTFSNWPTYPQLYSKGKLLGGLDIMEEMRDEGELLSSL